MGTSAPKNGPRRVICTEITPTHRVPRSEERKTKVIARAIPQGSWRAKNRAQWWTAIRNAPEFALMRQDSQRTLKRLANLILWRTETNTMTSMPTWKLLANMAGITKATVARHLANLRAWGLLGVVATGRKGKSVDGEKPQNDAAIYVLCVPAPPKKTPTVDKNETPFLLTEEGGRNPTYAREEPKPFYPPNEPTAAATRRQSRANRIEAAREMRRRSFPLRQISSKHLAYVAKPLFEAGWSLNDVLWAIDHRPDGQRWPHDGASGIRNIAPWLRHRLAVWAPDGSVLLSPTQLDARRALQAAAERDITMKRIAQRRANQSAISATAAAGAALVRQALRAARQRVAASLQGPTEQVP